ncbi:MAG: nicotinate-nucleotide adenylyltransferase [Halioglobus sp.]|nr:nicotinate-nucleotide adenylyltransferase [Halioglobus sp.]
MSRDGPLGVFGGTFNPVHYGHLRSAVELVERLDLAELRLMPSAMPPHRAAPECGAEHRAAMVALAVAEEPLLSCDDRELRRDGPSYTIDSLLELRADCGDARPLCMVMGCDAVQGIETWHRWTELLDVAHVVVLSRPGWALPERGVVADWLADNALPDEAALAQRPCGGVLVQELRPLDISSTEIRELLAAGRSIRYLMPQSVLDYIDAQQLYR